MRSLLLVAAVAVAVGCEPPTKEQIAAREKEKALERAVGDEYGARAAAKETVRKLLKHHLNADFHWDAEGAMIADGRWQVSGTVTAPNDFGAKLRKPYMVLLQFRDGGYLPLIVEYDGESVYANEGEVNKLIEAAEDRNEAIAADKAAYAAAERKELIAANMQKSIEASRRDKPIYQLRKWTFTDGTVVEGKLTGFGAGKLKLEVDGVTKEFPSSTLIADDQKFIADNLR